MKRIDNEDIKNTSGGRLVKDSNDIKLDLDYSFTNCPWCNKPIKYLVGEILIVCDNCGCKFGNNHEKMIVGEGDKNKKA